MSFMQLNAAHADLAIPGLPVRASRNVPPSSGIHHDQRLSVLSPIYRSFAAALNRHVYLQNLRVMPPPLDEYELLCYCMVSADSLAEGIKRAMKFVSALNGRGGTLSLSTRGETVVLTCEVGWTQRSISALSLDMLSSTFYCKLFSWLIGEPLTNLELTFSHSALLDPLYLHDLLPCQSHYDSPQTTIAFNKHILTRPIIKTQRQLTAMLACGPIEFLPTYGHRRISVQVKNLLRKSLVEQHQLPALDRVAYQLGKSASTLRRRLTVEGHSFQTLLDECRKHRAFELLESSQLTIDEIAWQVGFSERSAFSHAFKTWTDRTPSAYRETMYRPAQETSSVA
jgi:AraC-like DNA-binding protein